MAVFTPLDVSDLNTLWPLYALPPLATLTPIAEGTENSNFLITTVQQSRFILTLFEGRTKAEDVPYFMSLMQHLHQAGIPCPQPIAAHNGQVIHTLCGKSAVVMSFLEGHTIPHATAPQLYQVGQQLAKLHHAGADFPLERGNALSLAGWHSLAYAIGARAGAAYADLLKTELDFLTHHWPQHLPRGVVHADLFPDNVFFKDGQLSGVIDFYFSCTDFWAYDLAIVLNAWAFDTPHTINPTKAAALKAGYEAVRPLTPPEKTALPLLCRGAALRFLLTRLYDTTFPKHGLITPRNPQDYRARLEFFRQDT